MAYLVTGASGAVGSRIVSGLIPGGHEVHTLTRKPLSGTPTPGVASFLGDLSGDQFAPEMFWGVEKVFVFPASGSIDAFLAAARRGGVRHAVVLSSLAAAQEFPRDRRSVSALHHLQVERAVRDSGLEFTFLRPGSFANNLRQWAPTIQGQGLVFGPYPDSSQALIHEGDIADAAVAALTTSGHEGKIYALTGPESLTQRQQLEVISQAIGKPLVFQQITPEAFRQSMVRFVPETVVQMLLDYWSETVAMPDPVRDTAPVLGKPARTLAQWAADHAGDFR